MTDNEIKNEINRLNERFKDADENTKAVCEGLIEQAAFERIFLKQLNEQAVKSGLVKINPHNPAMQQSLPVSKAIATHSAALTNIIFKLCKLLSVEAEEDDEELSDYK